MNRVVIRRNSLFSFHKAKGNSNFSILAFFLIYDVGAFNVKLYQDWIFDDSDLCASANSTGMDKDEENPDNIMMYEVFSVHQGEIFDISKRALYNVLDSWQQLLLESSKEIIVTQHGNGEITLEANNENVFEEAALWLKDNGRYTYTRATREDLYSLAFFLEHDFSATPYCDIFGFREWIKNPEQNYFYDCPILVEKHKEIVSIVFRPNHPNKDKIFSIESQELIEMIDTFEKLAKQKAEVIVIQERDGGYVVDIDEWHK